MADERAEASIISWANPMVAESQVESFDLRLVQCDILVEVPPEGEQEAPASILRPTQALHVGLKSAQDLTFDRPPPFRLEIQEWVKNNQSGGTGMLTRVSRLPLKVDVRQPCLEQDIY